NWLVGKGYTPQSIAARWGASGNAYASWENVWPAINMSKTDFKGVALTNIGVARWDWYDFRQEASWKYMRNVVGWIRDAGENRPMVHEYNIVTPGGIAPFLRWNRVGAMPGFDGVHLASGSFEREFDYHAVLAYLAICKGASDPPWQSNELKGNMSPEWMTKHVWLLSALGGTGMVFWDWASEGWGVVNSDRKLTDSSAEALRLNREIGFYGDLLQGSKPMPNRVGILVLSEETYYSPYVHEREIMAVAKTLLEQGSGCEVATITDDEVLQKDISGYKVILVPSQEHMRQSVREKLAAFVKNGGTLWLTPGSASKSEADQVTPVNPGVPLNQVAGLSIGEEIPPVIATVAGGRGVAPLGMLSRSVTATTALPIRQMGNKPAIFRNRYGRGACYYQAAVTAYSPGKGTPILNDPEGLKSYIEINSGNLPSDLLSEALAGAGVAPYVKVFDGSGRLLSTVLVGVRKTNPGYLVFLIEAGNYTSNITVRLNSGRLGINGSWVAYAPNSLETKTVKSSSFTTLLKPSQVKIFHLVTKADSAKWIAAFKKKNWPAIAKTLPTVSEAKLVPPSEMGKVDPGDLRAIKPEPFGNKWLLVDISRHANRSLIEEGEKENAKSFIGSGGIGDNDLRALPVGMQEFLGVPFKILDSKVDKTTCMVTKSSSRPGLGPLEFKGIPIRDLVGKVHWLYGAGWAPFGLPIGYVTYHYADGTKAQENLICGKNILNWWGRNQSYESDKLRLAWAGSTPASTRNFQTVGLYH
ncbi:MAG: beta-galactosidase trimerization domain-containing protein, partial [Armatimonadota bacterium]